jgi:hypothetical protein
MPNPISITAGLSRCNPKSSIDLREFPTDPGPNDTAGCTAYRSWLRAGYPRDFNSDCLKIRATIEAVLSGRTVMELTAVVTHAEEGGFVALNPETGTTTQSSCIASG